MRKQTLSTIALIFITLFSASQAKAIKIEGQLLEKGTRKPIAEANVYCFLNSDLEKPLKVMTEKTGKFSIDLPEENFRWVISLPNYKRFEKNDSQTQASDNSIREFYLEKTSYLTYETTVYGASEKRDEKTKSLDQSQFLTVPGANGDPVKAIQNLPGVNRPNALSSQVIIEGSSPNDTRYNIDGQRVPIIFHFAGITSVVIPEAVDHVDYISAGFGPEYGQTTAGLVNLAIKNPQTDRIHAFVYADLLNSGGMVEGPINDHSSFLIGLRQSYIGAVLGAAVGQNNKNLSLTTVPDFRDTVIEYRNQLSQQDTFKVIAVGSQDSLGFLLKQPIGFSTSTRGNFSQETDFFRIIPEWTHQFDHDLSSRLTLGIGKDIVHFNIGDLFTDTNEFVVTGLAEAEYQLTPAWKSILGLDSQLYWTQINFELPVISNQGGVFNPIDSSSNRSVANLYQVNASGLYWRNTIHALDSPLTLTPGVRLSYYNQTHEWMPEPRLQAKYSCEHELTLRAATGLYDEAPPIQDMDAIYGNQNLKSQRAIHGTFGFEKDFREGANTGWTVTNDFFYKYLYDLVASSTKFVTPSQPQYYNNSGYGHALGIEVLAKYKTENWEGWISYTLSRSTVGNAESTEALAPYDQTHLLTLVGTVELGRNWKFSGRVRYSTGDPYTPITSGILDINNDNYTPIRGSYYSSRQGAFFQTDIRLDKKWIYNRWILNFYVDVENITNQKNSERINYNYNYQQTAVLTGIPILPTVGLKAEF